MESTISRDIVNQYLNSASSEFKEAATNLSSLQGDGLTFVEVRNLRNSIFTKYVRDFAIQERGSLSSKIFATSLSDFVEKFIQFLDDETIDVFSVFE